MSMQLLPILVYVEFKKTNALEGIVLAMYFCLQKWGSRLLLSPPPYSLDIAPQPLLCVRLSKHEAAGRFSFHGKREKGTLTDRRSVTALIPIETVVFFQ